MPKQSFIKPVEDDEKKDVFSVHTQIKCEYCGMEFPYAERWVHISRHRQVSFSNSFTIFLII
jgi:hypothetical protein